MIEMTGQLRQGQDYRTIQSGWVERQVGQTTSAWTRQRGEDSQNTTARTGELGQDNWDTITVAGQPGQDSRGRIVRIR
jgi:hypothetical protein